MMTAMPFTRPRHWLRWLLAAVAGLVVLAVAGPFVYIHFFNSTPGRPVAVPRQHPGQYQRRRRQREHRAPRPFSVTDDR
jgi:hypothetical protein